MTTQAQKKFKAKAKKAGVLPVETEGASITFSTAGRAPVTVKAEDLHRINRGGIAGEQLRQYVSKIEKLEQEKADISADVKDAYDEAGANGFDKKVLRKIIQRRKQDRNQLAEQEELMQIYLHALGDLPLFSHSN